MSLQQLLRNQLKLKSVKNTLSKINVPPHGDAGKHIIKISNHNIHDSERKYYLHALNQKPKRCPPFVDVNCDTGPDNNLQAKMLIYRGVPRKPLQNALTAYINEGEANSNMNVIFEDVVSRNTTKTEGNNHKVLLKNVVSTHKPLDVCDDRHIQHLQPNQLKSNDMKVLKKQIITFDDNSFDYNLKNDNLKSNEEKTLMKTDRNKKNSYKKYKIKNFKINKNNKIYNENTMLGKSHKKIKPLVSIKPVKKSDSSVKSKVTIAPTNKLKQTASMNSESKAFSLSSGRSTYIKKKQDSEQQKYNIHKSDNMKCKSHLPLEKKLFKSKEKSKLNNFHNTKSEININKEVLYNKEANDTLDRAKAFVNAQKTDNPKKANYIVDKPTNSAAGKKNVSKQTKAPYNQITNEGPEKKDFIKKVDLTQNETEKIVSKRKFVLKSKKNNKIIEQTLKPSEVQNTEPVFSSSIGISPVGRSHIRGDPFGNSDLFRSVGNILSGEAHKNTENIVSVRSLKIKKPNNDKNALKTSRNRKFISKKIRKKYPKHLNKFHRSKKSPNKYKKNYSLIMEALSKRAGKNRVQITKGIDKENELPTRNLLNNFSKEKEVVKHPRNSQECTGPIERKLLNLGSAEECERSYAGGRHATKSVMELSSVQTNLSRLVNKGFEREKTVKDFESQTVKQGVAAKKSTSDKAQYSDVNIFTHKSKEASTKYNINKGNDNKIHKVEGSGSSESKLNAIESKSESKVSKENKREVKASGSAKFVSAYSKEASRKYNSINNMINKSNMYSWDITWQKPHKFESMAQYSGGQHKKRDSFIKEIKQSFKHSEKWLMKQQINKIMWKNILREEKFVLPHLKNAISKLEIKETLESKEPQKEVDNANKFSVLPTLTSIDAVAKTVTAFEKTGLFFNVKANSLGSGKEKTIVNQLEKSTRTSDDYNNRPHPKRLSNLLIDYKPWLYETMLTDNKTRPKLKKTVHEVLKDRFRNKSNNHSHDTSKPTSTGLTINNKQINMSRIKPINNVPKLFNHLCDSYLSSVQKNKARNVMRGFQKRNAVLEYCLKHQHLRAASHKKAAKRRKLSLEYPAPETIGSKKNPSKPVARNKNRISADKLKTSRLLINSLYRNTKPHKYRRLPFSENIKKDVRSGLFPLSEESTNFNLNTKDIQNQLSYDTHHEPLESYAISKLYEHQDNTYRVPQKNKIRNALPKKDNSGTDDTNSKYGKFKRYQALRHAVNLFSKALAKRRRTANEGAEKYTVRFKDNLKNILGKRGGAQRIPFNEKTILPRYLAKRLQ